MNLEVETGITPYVMKQKLRGRLDTIIAVVLFLGRVFLLSLDPVHCICRYNHTVSRPWIFLIVNLQVTFYA